MTTTKTRRSIREAARRWQARRTHPAWRAASLALFDAQDTRTPLIGKRTAAIADVRVRDALLLSMITDSEDAVGEALTGQDGPATVRALPQGLTPSRPLDPARVALVKDALAPIVREGAEKDNAPAYTILAILAYWEGDKILGGMHLRTALYIDPEYRLARLVTLLWR